MGLVPFKITHICRIDKIVGHNFVTPLYTMGDRVTVTNKISTPAHAIGDRVVISETLEEYKRGSVGEIVGKYDKSRTWCVRMEDDFVILLEDSGLSVIIRKDKMQFTSDQEKAFKGVREWLA